ncbi:MAG: hypothetical protein GF308_16140 [Candidatus Heimdallarchaeota archaeon]|nr:hypothetical protein [Candidatus Heimdallarchaeota archaeon]
MSKRKIKLEMSDDQDNKITITFEGKVTEKNIQKMVSSANDILNNGSPPEEEISDVSMEEALDLSLIDRVKLLISTAFGMGSWFTTNDLCESFIDVYSVPLKTTTASTYLARIYQEGMLDRRGSRNERKYKLKKEYREKMPKLITQ